MLQSILAYIQTNFVFVTISTIVVIGVAGASIATYNSIGKNSNSNNPTIVDNNSSSSSSSNSITKPNNNANYNSTLCSAGQSFIAGRCR